MDFGHPELVEGQRPGRHTAHRFEVPDVLRNVRAAVLLAGCALAGCAQTAPATCDDPGLLAAQRAHTAAEVTLCGVVVRVRAPRRTRSGVHRSFIVDVGGGDRIEIDANLSVMGDVPVADGERAEVRGSYYYDPGGREGVDWTHHTGRGPHPPGFIVLNGTTYS
jgi:hypothetical protein